MPKFLIKASYSTQGIKGVMSDGGTGRAEAVGKAIAGVGGQMESFYFRSVPTTSTSSPTCPTTRPRSPWLPPSAQRGP